jgi:hypothetical protein
VQRYSRLFIKTSLVYLFFGVLIGAGMSWEPLIVERFRFVHIHINLLGFMTMMIAGVAYHVVPRFAARSMHWVEGIKYHYFLHNIGLLGMIGVRLIDTYEIIDIKINLFAYFAVVMAISLIIMVYNLYFTLQAPLDDGRPESITNDMKVLDLIKYFPQVLPVLDQVGFKKAVGACFSKGITIGQACKKHGLDTEPLVEKLNREIFSTKDCQKDCQTDGSPLSAK